MLKSSFRNLSSHARAFSSRSGMARLRIGFVPEHFSTPIAFAQKHYDLDAELIPFPTGTGALASALKAPDGAEGIDVAIGLTEGFVADLGRSKSAHAAPQYGLVGTYVESPLCWAISTGAQRSELSSISDLRSKRVGVSRIGSGSYVMSFVLADQHGWLEPSSSSSSSSSARDPFEVVAIGDFAALRKSVGADERSSEFFMWEHFTTKHYWDNGELKRLGEIYTPWPSWMIAMRDSQRDRFASLAEKLNRGVRHYQEHRDEAIAHITSTMHYSPEDAQEWMKTVRFARDVQGVAPDVIDDTVGTLRKAGVLTDSAGGSEHMISVRRAGQ